MRTPRRDLGTRQRWSRHARNAARVLPEPVGANRSVFRPAATSGQPRLCGGVGRPNVARNQFATDGSRASRPSGAVIIDGTRPLAVKMAGTGPDFTNELFGSQVDP